METLNRTFNNATNALLNEFQTGEQQQVQPHGEEPMSGIQGKGTATDPYDGGNRDDQPGAPHTTSNTAVIPEPLVSVTAGDHAKNPRSPSNADLALKNVIVDEPVLPSQKMEYQPKNPSNKMMEHPSTKKLEHPDPMTATAPTAAAAAAGAPTSGSNGAKQLSSAVQSHDYQPTTTTTGVSEQRGSLPGSLAAASGAGGSGVGVGAAEPKTLAIREKKDKDDILQGNKGLPAPAPAPALSSSVGGSEKSKSGSEGALLLQPQPEKRADTIPSASVAVDDKAKDKPPTATSQPQQQMKKTDERENTAGATDTARTISDTESVGPANETKDGSSAGDRLPTGGGNKVSEEALKGPQIPEPREPFEVEKRLGSKGGPAQSSDAAPGATKNANESEEHGDGKAHGHQGKMAHLKEKVGKVLHHSSK
ncbi:uncharacterized protein BO97DRAFT_404166 [Aspergillus homomorphus CBS 101889]|uniref:Uncharacterized protein n=1 Tax=Aspergillus homomorphus (strain CBS 101889) TaxID=1450537 RepID=A0A395I3U4_ASPHC|nr:hypothetical protein BO97DRAFT_404166 [Aspergillus homomorphus CBS 101889]RAL14637.1 hypothetical protein BO97DRAFT_404166 [Aspergillus homomorphus CBS 101889]